MGRGELQGFLILSQSARPPPGRFGPVDVQSCRSCLAHAAILQARPKSFALTQTLNVCYILSTFTP